MHRVHASSSTGGGGGGGGGGAGGGGGGGGGGGTISAYTEEELEEEEHELFDPSDDDDYTPGATTSKKNGGGSGIFLILLLLLVLSGAGGLAYTSKQRHGTLDLQLMLDDGKELGRKLRGRFQKTRANREGFAGMERVGRESDEDDIVKETPSTAASLYLASAVVIASDV